MAQSNMFFAGMKNSVDKSCLEAAASGCFVITTDMASAKLSGMTDFWELINGSSELPKLSEQIRVIMNTDSHSLEKFRMKVQSRAIELNSASELIARITQALREVR
jgi:ribosomal protein S10